MDKKQFIEVYNNVEKYPTIAKVAQKLGVHKRTVQKYAKKLKSEGVKLTQRTPSVKKDITSDIFLRVPKYRKKKERKTKNERVFVISDMHIPYHHKDSIEFFEAIKKTYKPDRVICIGDELDNHAMSYHESDPDTYSAGHELKRAREVIKEIETLFPEMDLVDSNHGSLYYRKAKTHGIPKEAMVPYNELLGVDDGWRWHFDLTIELSNGQPCYFHHGKTGDTLLLSQRCGMCAVQGHYHNKFKIDYWANTHGLYWGMSVGCLIDDTSLAFSYNKNTVERPIIGCGIIINGQPKLLPMILDSSGSWNGSIY